MGSQGVLRCRRAITIDKSELEKYNKILRVRDYNVSGRKILVKC